jgi:recombination protein RecR
MKNLDCINALINCFTRLPGVGYKTAERYAYKIVETDAETVTAFCNALMDVKAKVNLCKTCGNFTDTTGKCNICTARTESGIICVVRDPRDAIAIENCGAFRGTYHILHGCLSPLDKKGPDDINLKSLIIRVREESAKEVIIATSPTVEGEATANYIASLLKPSGVKVTRLAQGLSLGTNLEYADEVTLGAAINNRVII